jgi:hypothetical protein
VFHVGVIISSFVFFLIEPLQNSSLVSLDAKIDVINPEYTSKLEQLRNVIYEVHMFHGYNECVDYLTDVNTQQLSLSTTDVISPQFVPYTHRMPHLSTIYILCDKNINMKNGFNIDLKLKVFLHESRRYVKP